MAHVIAKPCIGVKDMACVEACPTEAIYSSPEEPMSYIHPQECVDCGLCVPVCPVEAIFPANELPGKWSEYAAINARFFEAKPD